MSINAIIKTMKLEAKKYGESEYGISPDEYVAAKTIEPTNKVMWVLIDTDLFETDPITEQYAVELIERSINERG